MVLKWLVRACTIGSLIILCGCRVEDVVDSVVNATGISTSAIVSSSIPPSVETSSDKTGSSANPVSVHTTSASGPTNTDKTPDNIQRTNTAPLVLNITGSPIRSSDRKPQLVNKIRDTPISAPYSSAPPVKTYEFTSPSYVGDSDIGDISGNDPKPKPNEIIISRFVGNTGDTGRRNTTDNNNPDGNASDGNKQEDDTSGDTNKALGDTPDDKNSSDGTDDDNKTLSNTPADTDNDGVIDTADNCPTTSNPNQANSDVDTFGDACDTCPNDAANDADSDGICGDIDNCPATPNASQGDCDTDGTGNACDTSSPCSIDIDTDGIMDTDDNCPEVFNPDQVDKDNDDFGDMCDTCPDDADNDADSDGICGDIDNCPATSNASQDDCDTDGTGNACDTSSPCSIDIDNDGIMGTDDNCPEVFNPNQADKDIDGFGDTCDTCPDDVDNDADSDGICGDIDNCPATSNGSQGDCDTDGTGNACDTSSPCSVDTDNDGIMDGDDNCPIIPNTDQTDIDNDSVGDECDDSMAGGDGGIIGTGEPVFAGCGGIIGTGFSGGGIIGTGSPALGTGGITGTDGCFTGTATGFGSVFVNGVEFFTPDAQIALNDSTNALESHLRLGMQVAIVGAIDQDGTTGSAEIVASICEVEGVIEDVPVNDPDNRVKTFTVFGKTVVAERFTTIFHASPTRSDSFNFDRLIKNDYVCLNGHIGNNGDLYATYIEDMGRFAFNTSRTIINGFVSNYNGSDQFSINSTLITISSETDFNAELIQNGAEVAVFGLLTKNSTIKATKIRLLVNQSISTSDTTDSTLFGVEGLATDIDEQNRTFSLNGKVVDYSGLDGNQLPFNLQNNIHLEVTGNERDGIVYAKSIRLRSGFYEISGIITQNDLVNKRIGVAAADGQDILVNIDSRTLVSNNKNRLDRNDTINALGEINTYIEIKALRDNNGNLTAHVVKSDKLKKKTTFLVKGEVDSYDRNNHEVTVLGITFSTSSFTDYELNDFKLGTEDIFFDTVSKGDIVTIEDARADGYFYGDSIADKIEIEKR